MRNLFNLVIDKLSQAITEGIAPSKKADCDLMHQIPWFYGFWYLFSIPLFAFLYWLPWPIYKNGDCIVDHFLHFLYFSAVTVTTLGYGDITPQNLPAMFFSGIHSVLGVGLIGFFLNSLSHQHAEIIRKEERHFSTGGKSYPALILLENDSIGWPFRFQLQNKGDYHLSDLTMEVQDISSPEKEIIDQKKYLFLSPGGTGLSDIFNFLQLLKDKSQCHLQIQFNAKNGKFTQEIKIFEVKGNWNVASQITARWDFETPNVTETIELEVSRDFPRDKSGNIRWS